MILRSGAALCVLRLGLQLGLPRTTFRSVAIMQESKRSFASALAATRIVKFISADHEYVGKGKVGESLLDVVVNNDLPLDGYGACEGTLACCTCHVILSEEHFKRQDRVNPQGEEELDLIDLAPELCDTSRLGCQVKIEPDDPEEIVVHVPAVTRDARALD